MLCDHERDEGVNLHAIEKVTCKVCRSRYDREQEDE